MKKNIFLLGLMVCSMTMVAQTKEEKPEGWYFKLGESYFLQTASTEFPSVGGNLPLSKIYKGGKLVSEESVTGSFGEGFRTGLTAGYRFNTRLGVELGINYYNSNSKTMAQTVSDLPIIMPGTIYNFKSAGKITALDLAPALVLFLGEHNGFEPYTKIGILVPVYGNLKVNTDARAPVAFNPTTGAPIFGDVHSVDKVNPNPTMGYMAVFGTSYRLGKNISIFAELEYRNFTVHGKTKETTEFTVNGKDALAGRTASQIHTNYIDKLDNTSNSPLFSSTTSAPRPNEAMDELSSFVGISGVGFTLGIKFNL